MKLLSQAEPAELFAQHSTEKFVAVSFTCKVLLEIHAPSDLLSGKKLWIPSVISSVQLKKKADQFWFLAHGGIFQGRRWDASKHVLRLCWKGGKEGGIDGFGFYLSLLEWGFRAVARLNFFVMDMAGSAGGELAPHLLHWAYSHSPSLPWQGTRNPDLQDLHQFHSRHDPRHHVYSHWFHLYLKHSNCWAVPNEPLLKQ